MSNIKSIGVIGYHHCGEQDTMAPWEIFASLAWVLSQSNKELSVELVGYSNEVITMQMGAQVQSQVPFDKDKRYDLLYIPGGMGSGEASKDEVLKKDLGKVLLTLEEQQSQQHTYRDHVWPCRSC